MLFVPRSCSLPILLVLAAVGVGAFAGCKAPAPVPLDTNYGDEKEDDEEDEWGTVPVDVDGGIAPDEVGLSTLQIVGKRLFEDTNLSDPPGVSCASCHDAKTDFIGNNGSPIPAVPRGITGHYANRNAPTLKYTMFSPKFRFEYIPAGDGSFLRVPQGGQSWDGSDADLETQALTPLLDPRAMNMPSPGAVVNRIAASSYAVAFRHALGKQIFQMPKQAFIGTGVAIGGFQRAPRFFPFSSKFDGTLRGEALLDPTEAHGFELFKDPEKGNCLSCHAGIVASNEPADWIFTDFTYANLGVPRNAEIPDNADPNYYDLGLCRNPNLAAVAPSGFDLDSLCGAFKVPTLRNVERTAPYGHNGYFKTLRDVVKFHVTRDTNPELWYPKDGQGVVQKWNDLPDAYHGNVVVRAPFDRKPGDAPRLTDDDIDAIIAFLKTLTDK